MSLSSMLDRSLTLTRAVVTQSPSGAPQRAFATVQAGMPFAAAPMSDRLIESYDRRGIRVDYMLWTNAQPVGTSFAINDVIADPVTEEKYAVLAVKKFANARVSSDTLWELHCFLTDD